MQTDPTGLLEGGLALVEEAWREAEAEWNWSGIDRFVMHQVSTVHIKRIVESLGLDKRTVPLTFPTLGNVGPASVPITLAAEADNLTAGDRVLCMGVGSGLNTTMTEIVW